MSVNLNKESEKNLENYVEYVNANPYTSAEELRNDLNQRGLSDEEINWVMSFYKPPKKQRMFAHPFSFQGRIRRMECWISYIISYAYIFLNVILFVLNDISTEGAAWYIAGIPLYWFSFAQRAKRCHDLGHSGWFQIIPLYDIWLLFFKGDTGENQYGPDPKA